MSEVAIKVVRDGQAFDIALGEFDLMQDDGLYTDVILSLFTDARANDDDPLPDNRSSDRRGYWGDQFSPVQGDRHGSRLWLLSRSKQLPEVVEKVRRYAYEALAWMVADGLAKSVEVSARVVRTGVLGLEVFIKTVESTVLRYEFEIHLI
jgi:phage gp46-like protein